MKYYKTKEAIEIRLAELDGWSKPCYGTSSQDGSSFLMMTNPEGKQVFGHKLPHHAQSLGSLVNYTVKKTLKYSFADGIDGDSRGVEVEVLKDARSRTYTVLVHYENCPTPEDAAIEALGNALIEALGNE